MAEFTGAKKLPRILDLTFMVAALFALMFIIMRYYVKSLALSALFALVSAAAISAVLMLLSKKKHSVRSKKAQSVKLRDQILKQLVFDGDAKNLTFFKKLLSAKYECEHADGCILFRHEKSLAAVVPMLRFEMLTPQNIADCYRAAAKHSPDIIYIIANGCNQKAQALSDSVMPLIRIVEGAKLFELMDKYKTFPRLTLPAAPPSRRKTLRAVAALCLNRKRTKGFCIAAVVLFISSVFMQFALYYFTFGIFCIAAAVVSFLNIDFLSDPNRASVREL